MGIIEVIMLGVGLAMDAFAVSVCKGLSMFKMNWKKAIIVGIYFGVFQAVMPLMGYLLGKNFEEQISNIDHWISFILLAIIGFNMIKESLSKETETSNDSVKFKDMITLAIATSIDALAAGITLVGSQINIIWIIVLIGIITFVLSMLGVKTGNVFGDKYKKKAELTGGIILIILGIKILLEHLSIISF